MNARPSHVTNVRRVRERVYLRRLRWAALCAVLFHLSLFATFARVKHHIPLVRHMGYEGVVRILPEISVRRVVGERESEAETAQGRGSEPFFRVVNTRAVSEPVPTAERAQDETGEFDEEFGEDLLRHLEQALPQPTGRDVIVARLVKPAYPRRSIEAGVEGVVVFRVHVTKRGRVGRVWLVDSEVDRECEDAARRAITRWRFEPHLVDGAAVDFLVDQRIRFRLQGAPGVGPSTGR